MTEDRSFAQFLKYLDEMEGQYGGQGQSEPFGWDIFVSSTRYSNGSVRSNPQNVYLTLDHYISPVVASPA